LADFFIISNIFRYRWFRTSILAAFVNIPAPLFCLPCPAEILFALRSNTLNAKFRLGPTSVIAPASGKTSRNFSKHSQAVRFSVTLMEDEEKERAEATSSKLWAFSLAYWRRRWISSSVQGDGLWSLRW